MSLFTFSQSLPLSPTLTRTSLWFAIKACWPEPRCSAHPLCSDIPRQIPQCSASHTLAPKCSRVSLLLLILKFSSKNQTLDTVDTIHKELGGTSLNLLFNSVEIKISHVLSLPYSPRTPPEFKTAFLTYMHPQRGKTCYHWEYPNNVSKLCICSQRQCSKIS